MKRTIKISTLLLMLLLTFMHTGYANGGSKFQTKKPMTTEEVYEAEGYTTFKNATKEFEKKCNSKVILPRKIPFKVEHKYGKFEVDHSQVIYEYLGERFKGKQLKVVISLKSPGKFEGGSTDYLKNGTKVVITQTPTADYPTTIYFKKNNLYYYVTLFYPDKELAKKKIMEVANSFEL